MVKNGRKSSNGINDRTDSIDDITITDSIIDNNIIN